MAADDIQVRICLQEIVKLDLEIKACIQVNAKNPSQLAPLPTRPPFQPTRRPKKKNISIDTATLV